MKRLDTDPLKAAKRAWFRLKQIFMGRKSPYGIFLEIEARRLDEPTLDKLGPNVPERLKTLDALINEWIEKDLPDVTTHEPFRGLIKPAVRSFVASNKRPPVARGHFQCPLQNELLTHLTAGPSVFQPVSQGDFEHDG